MTLIYKKVSQEHPLIKYDKALFLAANRNTNKVLMHEKSKSHDVTLQLPLVNFVYLLNKLTYRLIAFYWKRLC